MVVSPFMFRAITQDEISAIRQKWRSRVYDLLTNPSSAAAEAAARDPLWQRLVAETERAEYVRAEIGMPSRYRPQSPSASDEPYAGQAAAFPANTIISTLLEAANYPGARYEFLAIPGAASFGSNPASLFEYITSGGSPVGRELERGTAPYHTFTVQPGDSDLGSGLKPAAGFTNELIEQVRERLYEMGALSKPKWWLTTYAHEVGHSFYFPLVDSASVVMDLARKHGGNLPDQEFSRLVESIAKHANYIATIGEAQADMFAAATTLSPRALLEFRYNAGLQSYIEQRARMERRGLLTEEQRQANSQMRYGSPIRMRVISPSVVEGENSPLHQRLREFTWSVLEQARQTPPEQQDIMVSKARELLEHMEAYRSSMESGDLAEAQNRYNMALISTNRLVNLALVYSSLALEGNQSFPEETRPVTDHLSSRLWTISYMLAKSHPELIGQEVEIYPDRIELRGKKLLGFSFGRRTIKPEEILPEEIPMLSMGALEHVHPLQLESTVNAQELYRRAREVVRAGTTLDDRSGEDVIAAWQRVFRDQVAGAMP